MHAYLKIYFFVEKTFTLTRFDENNVYINVLNY